MAENKYIVAIELGSSKIAGIVGTKANDGNIKILAYAQKESISFIRKGVVFNIDQTVAALLDIKKQLEETIDRPISRAYVGICGLSTHSKLRVISRHFMEETRITAEIEEGITKENVNQSQTEEDILDVITQEYRIGNTTQTEPIGALTTLIEGNFLNIVARPSIRKHMQRCFEQAGIQVIEFIVSPQATATTALAAAETRSGCALVDVGAETTTVSVFKSNLLRYLSVIPIGSASITRDLCTPTPLEEEEAEDIKRKYGTALFMPHNEHAETEKEVIDIPLTNSRSLSSKTVALYTSARAEEILTNAWQQIKNSGYDGELLGGIILTGGGSNLNKMEEAMQAISQIKPCRLASSIRSSIKFSGAYPSNAKDGACLTILGLLTCGNEECCPPKTEEAPEVSTYGHTMQILPEEPVESIETEEEEDKTPKKASNKRRLFGETLDKIKRGLTSIIDDDK